MMGYALPWHSRDSLRGGYLKLNWSLSHFLILFKFLIFQLHPVQNFIMKIRKTSFYLILELVFSHFLGFDTWIFTEYHKFKVLMIRDLTTMIIHYQAASSTLVISKLACIYSHTTLDWHRMWYGYLMAW